MSFLIRRPWDGPTQDAAPSADVFAPPSVFIGSAPGVEARDVVNSAQGSVTGSIEGRAGWIQTSSGNFLTGGARPDFDGSTLTIFCEIELTSAPTSGQGHFVGTVGDQFVKLQLNFAAGNVGFNSSVYIAGSQRGATELTKGSSAAIGDRLFCGFYFRQPDLVSFAAWNGGPLVFGAPGAYGAAIADSGSALYVGRDSGGTNPFSGFVRTLGVVKRTLPTTLIRQVYAGRWSALFEPSRIFVPMSAAAGGTFKAAWARNSNSVIQAAL